MANLIRLGGGGEFFSKLKIVVPEDVDSVQCYMFNDDGSVTEVFDGDRMDPGSVLVTYSTAEGVAGKYYEVPNEFPYFEVTVEKDVVYSLEDYSWDKIVRLAKAGLVSKMFNIGDTKTLTLSDGSSTEATIIGFNHDEKADESGYCDVTFDFYYLHPTTGGYHNEASFSGVGTWELCDLRTIILPTIFSTLPQVLQDNIEEVVKDTASRWVATMGGAYTKHEDTTEKIFPISCVETGASTTGYDGIGEEYGTAYQYYADGGSLIKTLSGETTATSYWTRNPQWSYFYSSTSRNAYYVTTSGTIGRDSGIVEQCTSIAFCL